ASPGPALAFLAASTFLNPQLFIVMVGGLGLSLALAHTAGVLLLSVPVGLLAQRLRREAFLKKGVLPDPLSPTPTPPPFPLTEGKGEGQGKGVRGLLSTLLRLTETIGLYFVISVILAALLQAFVPSAWVSSLLGTGRWHGVLLAGVLGVPFYACGGGAVPLIAGLVAQGMSPGAALAFFLAGPATRLTSLAALGTLLNRRALAVYVAYVVTGAALAGLVLNLVLGT
ncbi:MAG: permease, partial [Anaerolineae bacterium]